MNVMQIIQQIHEQYPNLTKSEKKVADYILSSGEKIVYNTMNDVKQATRVGDATIIRFCQKLGFSGFSDLKIEIAKEDFSKQKVSHKGHQFFDDVAENLKHAIDQTSELVDAAAIEDVVTRLHEAANIYIFGVGSSGQSAEDFEKMLLRVGIHAKAITDPHFQAQIASSLGQEDLVIAFSLTGRTKDTFESVAIAKENQVPVVVVTNYLLSPIARKADVILQTAIEEQLLNGGSLAGKISQLYVCDVLVSGYEMKYHIDALGMREKVARSIMDKLLDQ